MCLASEACVHDFLAGLDVTDDNSLPPFSKSVYVVVEDADLIPALIDQHAWAHLRSPMDMMRHGWAMILFQASQQWSRMSA